MRRAGVRPWTATAAVLPLVFFGAGEENIAYAFQINFNASLAFGLVHLLLADHDGPVDQRDWLALLAGFAGLMSSGIAATMVVVVCLAMLVRRGWRVAVLHTAPLGVAYLVWYAAIARDAYDSQDVSNPIAAIAFARTTIAAGFGGLAQVPGLGWALGGLIISGLVLAWRGQPSSRLRQVAAAPAALAVGAFLFVLITAFGRVGFAPGIERSTRYIYVVAVLLLPVVAVAADAVMRRWPAAIPVFLVALVASLVGNIQDFSNARAYSGEFLANYRNMMLAIPAYRVCRSGAAGPASRTGVGSVRVDRLAPGWCGVGAYTSARGCRAEQMGRRGGPRGPAAVPRPPTGGVRDRGRSRRNDAAAGQLDPGAGSGPVLGHVHRFGGSWRVGPVPRPERPGGGLRRSAEDQRDADRSRSAGRVVRPGWRAA